MSRHILHEPPEGESSNVDAPPYAPRNPRSEIGHFLAPASSESVMLVVDDQGYLTPLCTAGDLLRWCKAAWRTEQD